MPQKITAIKLQKKNRNRVNIYLDGKFGFGLSKFVAGWLTIGQELTSNEIEALIEKDTEEITYQKTLHFLQYRIRSVKEVQEYLKKRQISSDLRETIIKRLKENKLLNDKEFARNWVENRVTFHPRSKRLLKMELRQKGISEEIIEQEISHVNDEEMALIIARKQSRRYAKLEWFPFRKKLTEFLARKGFDYSTISPVIQQIWNELENDNNENETKRRLMRDH